MKLYRLLLLLLLLIPGRTAFAQDFLKDYKQYLKSCVKYPNDTAAKLTDASIERLKLTFSRFEQDYKEMFTASADTVYLVDYYMVESGWTSALLWTRSHSCYYRYESGLKNWKLVKKKVFIETDAHERLIKLLPAFKDWVEAADTSSYSKYARRKLVLDGSFINFTRAVKTNGQWQFVSSDSYETDVDKL